MTSIDNKLSNLSDDIRGMIQKAHGKDFEMLRVCRDNEDPVQLNDQSSVLDITRDEFVGIFDYNRNHYFLPPDQACRLGVFCKLSIPALIAFILKAKWEIFLSDVVGTPFYLNTKNGKGLFSIPPERISQKFEPKAREIFDFINDWQEEYAMKPEFGQVSLLIKDLLVDYKFLRENCFINKEYNEKQSTESRFMQSLSADELKNYQQLKNMWQHKSAELDDMLFQFERRKRINTGIENKYYKTFAVHEKEKINLSYSLEKFKIISKLIKRYPDASYRKLIQLADKELLQAEQKRTDLKNKLFRSYNFIGDIFGSGSFPCVTNEWKKSYTEACKKLLKKLYLLLHSDTCPDYASLTTEKKNEINRLWLELMKSTKEEMYSYSPSMLLYSMPDYEYLESIYHRACKILGINPKDFEIGNQLQFLIRKGVPKSEIFDFLKKETEYFELHMARLELVQDEYTNATQTQLYMEALSDIPMHTQKLKTDIKKMKDEISNLKQRISTSQLKTTRL